MLMIKEILILALIYYWFIAVSAAEVIKTKPCKKGRDLDVKSEVHEVSISPCPNGGSCELYRGENATITVKFTPTEVPAISTSCKVKSKLAWVSKIEMDFGGISSNACDYMACPIQPNVENVFNATFFVSKMWPIGTYPLKLRIQEKGGPRRVFVCQLFKLNLADQPADNVVF
ncbi:MD-2-related lipid-recognition protein [Orchesella cincta]|uniref:MD-2-related lipid-recognition protein n=1 Tax=Orchesella cincta TaxID=48709 RepID=A0A1D2N6D6_ORCCI|nr:MD-2-related lipid-recognition protein [Orchesella cincta]